MHKLIPSFCLNIHFESFPKANTQITDSFSIRHRALKYILKLLTWGPVCLRYSGAQCAAKHPQTVQRQLCCWKACACGEDCADMRFHAQLLHRYSQHSLFQKEYWKITKKTSVELLLTFFYKAFHRDISKLCSCYHCEPSPIQGNTNNYFTGFRFFASWWQP